MAELDALLTSIPPEEAQLTLLKFIFIKVTEIDGSLGALTPVIGAMAGKLGIRGEQIRPLIEKYAGQ